ncbi:MAG: hypothetical protein J6Q89_09010 [Clostridia bacterium]|nr:hypothetical protein [Clostridia bacterium]
MERKKTFFSSKRVLKKAIDEYFNVYLAETNEIADIESLADFLGVTRDEIMSMMNDKRFGSVLKIARNRIAKIKKQLAFGGKIPAAVLAFDLKNNHGYRDKPEDNDASSSQETVIFKGKTVDWAK